jgi:nucleoid-associated protein YgaU
MVTIPYWFIRYGPPVGFLALATAAILLVRPALHDDIAATAVRPPPPPPPAEAERGRVLGTRVSSYSVRSGDTLGTIAERFGKTVDELLVLNPGIDPHALRVGQSLRVD